MTSRASRTALALALLTAAPAALAQREGYAYLSWVGSEVTLVSTAEDDTTARPNTPILAGDKLSTGSTSRAEAILADGNVLRVDVQTSLRFDRLARTYESEDTRNAIYLQRGALSLEHRWSTSRDEATRIDTDDATIVFPDKGLVRIETGRRGTEVYVASGRAEVYARTGRATLRAGQYAFASGDAELEVDALGEPRDRFTRFVEERRDLASGRDGEGYVSADYGYDYAVADFDRYGSWVSIGGSSCWRPSVSAGWRPYTDGYWRWSPAGLTWVSYEPWGWLPYHYGSWVWDVGFGWCWTPGIRYSPAWVYWSYTPSWVGWCPIGYYGGYYGGRYGSHWDDRYRSARNRRGAERWTLAYPHLRGRVDVGRVDPRGWSWASVNRIGSRFDTRRDVLGQESVPFRPGERGVVATAPLRIDRGRGTVTTAVQDAVRRVPQTVGAEPRGGGLDDITPILRREGTLGTREQEGLRRAFVNPGEDAAYRPVPAEQIARRDAPGGSAASAPARGGERGLGSSTAPAAPPREGWRDGGSATETRGTRETGAAPRRAETEPPLRGGYGRDGGVRGDDGWRSPGSETRGGTTPSRTIEVPSRRSGSGGETGEAPSRSGSRTSAPEPEPWREPSSKPTFSRERPAVPDASAPPARREAPAPRGDEGWRGGEGPSRPVEAPRPAPAPRTEAPPSRSYEAPPSRSYESPRSAPAPRREAPPSRSYEAPRSQPAPRYEAPPSRSYEAPRSQPAPRYEAPPSRSYEAPRSAPAPRYEAPSRSTSGSSSGSSPRSSGSSSRSGGSPRTRSETPRG